MTTATWRSRSLSVDAPIADDRERFALAGLVRQPIRDRIQGRCREVGEAFDQTQQCAGCAHDRREVDREHGEDHFRTDVGQETHDAELEDIGMEGGSLFDRFGSHVWRRA
jgi:hypothetical protein